MIKMVIRLVIRSVIQLLGGKHFEVLVGVLDKMPASIWSVVVLFCCTYSDSMLDLMLEVYLDSMWAGKLVWISYKQKERLNCQIMSLKKENKNHILHHTTCLQKVWRFSRRQKR